MPQSHKAAWGTRNTNRHVVSRMDENLTKPAELTLIAPFRPHPSSSLQMILVHFKSY